MRNVNLILELGGTSMFFINGESLILDLLVFSPDASSPYTEHQQTLSAIEQIERKLNAIKECGGNFRIVFFECFKWMFLDKIVEPSFWILRQCFVMHCARHGIDYVIFNHWYGQDYKKYLREWRPSFMLLADNYWEQLDEVADEEEDEETGEPVVEPFSDRKK